MIAGGKVLEVRQSPRDPLILWIQMTDCDGLAAAFIRTRERIRPGDRIWWRGHEALWTSADFSRRDVRIARVAASGPTPPQLAADWPTVEAGA